MEYETDNELNYNTLHIRATLDLINMNEKAKKRTRTQIPREWARKSLFKNYFY